MACLADINVDVNEVLVYLDTLRESGTINMCAAGSWIQNAFGVNRREARRLLRHWQETFVERNAPEAELIMIRNFIMRTHKHAVGDVVMVWEDPYTKTRLEGRAKIVARRESRDYYDVEFLDEPGITVRGRFIY